MPWAGLVRELSPMKCWRGAGGDTRSVLPGLGLTAQTRIEKKGPGFCHRALESWCRPLSPVQRMLPQPLAVPVPSCKAVARLSDLVVMLPPPACV